MSLDTRPPKGVQTAWKERYKQLCIVPAFPRAGRCPAAGDHAKEGASHVTTCSQEKPRDALRGQAAVLKWGIEQSNQLETLVSRNKK